MTNTVALERLIAERGIKKGKLANSINVSYHWLKKKINNEVPFTAGEILILCDLLGINDLRQREEIFFAKEVD